jgi:hypothetical protein
MDPFRSDVQVARFTMLVQYLSGLPHFTLFWKVAKNKVYVGVGEPTGVMQLGPW